MATIHVSPAYGRDYKSALLAQKDWKEGKDFIFHDPSSRYDGKPCSVRDFPEGTKVCIRYKSNTRVTIL